MTSVKQNLDNGIRLKVHIPIKRKQKGVVGSMLFLLLRFEARVVLQLVAKEVVHVHYLRPPAKIHKWGYSLTMFKHIRKKIV